MTNGTNLSIAVSYDTTPHEYENNALDGRVWMCNVGIGHNNKIIIERNKIARPLHNPQPYFIFHYFYLLTICCERSACMCVCVGCWITTDCHCTMHWRASTHQHNNRVNRWKIHSEYVRNGTGQFSSIKRDNIIRDWKLQTCCCHALAQTDTHNAIIGKME